MLDEIDKLGFDYRGDPSSALLEALDPEQIKILVTIKLSAFDLSDVVFITTANNLETIPPLYRLMEIIDFPATLKRKLHIAKLSLPKQVENHGLTQKIEVRDEALLKIITKYTVKLVCKFGA